LHAECRVIPLGTRGLLAVIAGPARPPGRPATCASRTHLINEIPGLTNGVPALTRAPREAVTWQNAARRVSRQRGVCPACSFRQPFCRRVVSWRGVLFGHNRTRPLHIWDGGALLGLPHQAGQFPSSPGSSGRPSGPSTRAKCQFPSSPHVPGVAPGVVPVSDARQGQTPARSASFPALLTSPELPPGWCPFPATARAKHPR
jgi:hypothetical protein